MSETVRCRSQAAPEGWPAAVRGIVAARPSFGEGDVVSALQELQESLGYLPREAMDELARLSGIPVARFYGVATFYGQFHLEPHGRHTIRLCRGTACHVRSAPAILAAVERHLGIRDGQTTADMMFSIETVACLGACALAPVMVVDGVYYGRTTPGRACEVIDRIAGEDRSCDG